MKFPSQRMLAAGICIAVFACVGVGTAAVPNLVGTVDVKQFGAKGDDTTDDTEAIAAAIAARGNAGGDVLTVYFPPGTYRISRNIAIPSSIRLYGAGQASVIHQSKSGISIFTAGGDDQRLASHITVEMLGFAGTGGFQNSYGLSVVSVQDVKFRNNFASKIPLISISSRAASGATEHSTNFEVIGNQATGQIGEGAAILVSFSDHGLIKDNHIDTYDQGIQYWGGDATHPPATPGVSDLVITGNDVHNVAGGGIWGSEGRHIDINGNVVAECEDVCLDAEASTDVTIRNNTVGNARNGGIAAFYASTHIDISSNEVTQDADHGSAIYIHGTGTTTAVTITDNRLMVAGKAPAIDTAEGALSNSGIKSNSITTAKSPAIHLLEGSGLTIASNIIKVGGASGIVYEGAGGGNISDNTISTADGGGVPDTSQGGIHIIWRSKLAPAQHNQIRDNTISGFPISINDDCWGDHTSLNVITGNTLDSIYHRGDSPSYRGVIMHNHANAQTHVVIDGRAY